MFTDFRKRKGVRERWRLNPQTFGVWDDIPTNSATWLRKENIFLNYLFHLK